MMEDHAPPRNNGPVQTFRSGALSVSIWENHQTTPDGQARAYQTISFERRYKDQSGSWKSSTSLREQDIPRAIVLLQKAYEHLVLTESQHQQPELGG